MSATSEESIESQFESLALADDACYDETKEQATFTPMVFQKGNDGEIAVAVSHDPEERAAMEDFPELVELLLKKIEALPERPRIDIVWGCYSLATLYWSQYSSGRNTETLDQALVWAERANALIKEHNIDPWGWPRLTPELFLLKFEVSQMQEDLEYACRLLRDFLAGSPENSYMKGIYAGEAYRLLWRNYEYHPNAKILEEAVFFAQVAEDSPCKTEQQHGERLLACGIAVFTLGYRTKNRDNTRRAIEKFDQALSKGLDSSDTGRAKHFRSRAYFYLALTAEVEPADLEQSGTNYFESMMGDSVQNKYEFAEYSFQVWEGLERSDPRKEFIDKAEVTVREIISCEEMRASPTSHAAALVLAGQISEAYHIEYENHRETELEDPSTYWMQCWRMSTAPLHYRLLANQLLSRRLFKQGKYEDAWMNFEKAVSMIQTVCPEHFSLDDKKHLIESLHEISIDACATALALGNAEKALEVLEQGRGLLHSHFDKSPYNIAKLKDEHKTLFERFERARNRNLHSTQPGAGCAAEESVETVLAQIRRLPHYNDFLRSLNVEEMRSLAKAWPIVVLVGSFLGQYAIIVGEHGVQSIDLHDAVHPEHRVSHKELRHMSREWMSRIMEEQGDFIGRNENLVYVLKRLWKGVVEPISDALGLPEVESPPNIKNLILTSVQSHVTWIRAGDFHRLPVNMALDVSSDYPVLFAGRVTSSFASSFRVLSTGRSLEPRILGELEQGFVVSMPPTSTSASTANDNSTRASLRLTSPWIRNAKKETSWVTEASPNIKWNVLERPSPQDVQERCLNSPFLHFICHGVSDSKDPMKSHLRLWKKSNIGKGRVEDLTVSQIFDWTTERVCVAFLSSCSSADASEPSLFEENIDICNTLNMAGVHDVVGSTWPVSDAVAATMAKWFWRFFNDFMPDGQEHESGVVARALNCALIITSAEHAGEPLAWAGFLHVGGPI